MLFGNAVVAKYFWTNSRLSILVSLRGFMETSTSATSRGREVLDTMHRARKGSHLAEAGHFHLRADVHPPDFTPKRSLGSPERLACWAQCKI